MSTTEVTLADGTVVSGDFPWWVESLVEMRKSATSKEAFGIAVDEWLDDYLKVSESDHEPEDSELQVV